MTDIAEEPTTIFEMDGEFKVPLTPKQKRKHAKA